MRPDVEREAELERIRRTYARYRLDGRDGLWDKANLGYARIVRDRDWRLVELIRASLPVDGSILDVGCGPGDLAHLVRTEVGEVSWTGDDLLPEAIHEARQRRPWAHWLEASVDQLPFPDATFDVVAAATLFSSLPAPTLERAAVSEVVRVLRPSGWLIWYDLRYDSPRNSSVHGVNGRRLKSLFPGWRIEVMAMTLLPSLARRLGRLTPMAYPLLHAVPALRSHLIGRLGRSDRRC